MDCPAGSCRKMGVQMMRGGEAKGWRNCMNTDFVREREEPTGTRALWKWGEDLRAAQWKKGGGVKAKQEGEEESMVGVETCGAGRR